MRRSLRLISVAVVAILAIAGCGDDDTSSTSDGSGTGDEATEPSTGLVVATTVSPITSITASVVGDLVEVRGIVPEGTNSHTFEPPPSVSELLDGADVVFANGLQLEEPTLELAEQVASGAEIVRLGDLIVSPDEFLYDFSFPESEGKPNPHLWTDPTLAAQYANRIADTMVGVDPDNAETYQANRDAFLARLDQFDAALRQALATVPAGNRKLLTYHDAYAYWAKTYDWDVIGAIQPADFGDPTPREVADLIDQVRAAGVPAIFGSEVFPSPVLAQIADEADVEYVDDLRDDDLPGEPGDPQHSYLGLMKFDYVTIVDALGGDPAALEAFEVTDGTTDRASYPQ